MSFEEESDYFPFIEEDYITPLQWEQANTGLVRGISLDNTENILAISYQAQSPVELSPLVENHSDSQTQHEAPQRATGRRTETKDSNYEKNICAYITKKAVQCFLASTYKRTVEKLCLKYGCKYAELHKYYEERFNEVFGITHLSLLITPQQENEINMKKVFRSFLKWFIREKYMFYLLKYGKMTEKEKYVEFKNKYLLYIDQKSVTLKSY